MHAEALIYTAIIVNLVQPRRTPLKAIGFIKVRACILLAAVLNGRPSTPSAFRIYTCAEIYRFYTRQSVRKNLRTGR